MKTIYKNFMLILGTILFFSGMSQEVNAWSAQFYLEQAESKIASIAQAAAKSAEQAIVVLQEEIDKITDLIASETGRDKAIVKKEVEEVLTSVFNLYKNIEPELKNISMTPQELRALIKNTAGKSGGDLKSAVTSALKNKPYVTEDIVNKFVTFINDERAIAQEIKPLKDQLNVSFFTRISIELKSFFKSVFGGDEKIEPTKTSTQVTHAPEEEEITPWGPFLD